MLPPFGRGLRIWGGGGDRLILHVVRTYVLLCASCIILSRSIERAREGGTIGSSPCLHMFMSRYTRYTVCGGGLTKVGEMAQNGAETMEAASWWSGFSQETGVNGGGQSVNL